MSSPTFFSDGHTPNKTDPQWVILQKILGALYDINGGGSGGGPFVEIAGDTMTGRLVSPNVNFTAQGSTPAAPASGFVEFADSTGRKSWIRASDGFVRTWDATLTANRVYTLPDATTTIAGLAVAQTFSAANTFSANGALSAPAVSFTGTPITGGTQTTTKPLCLIETSGATSTGWSTSGTMLGVNAPNAFAGALLDIQLNGTSKLFVSSAGAVSATSLTLSSSQYIKFGADAFLTRKSAANWQLGDADAAAPVAQTLSVQSVVAGTSNTAGSNFTIKGSAGTGTGAGGNIVFQVAPAGGSGTSQNSFVTVVMLNGNTLLTTLGGSLQIPNASTLQTTSRGDIAFPADGIVTLRNNASNDFSRLQFGGTTSSFPSLKRSTTTLEARLADDSGYAATQTLYDRFGSGSPESAVTAPVGAVYHRTDGGAGTSFYVKESGAGNTGWVAK